MQENFSITNLMEHKDFRKLKLFVDLGFEISLTEHNGDTLEKFGDSKNIIYDLIIANDIDRIKSQPKHLLNTQNSNGYTPLHWAIISKREAITDYIIAESFNHFSETITGENCFSLAARYDNTSAFNKLMIDLKNHSLYQANDRGFNALLFSAARKNTSIIETCVLNSSSSDLRARNMYGANFFHWLFHGKNFPDQDKESIIKNIFNMICKKIPKNDIKEMLREKNAIGYTPMAWLEHYDNQATIKFIKGALYT